MASFPASQLPDNENPVKKELIFHLRTKGKLYLDELNADDAGYGGRNEAANAGSYQATSEREQLQATYLQMASLR
jgi:hypothetical protein